MAGHEQGSQVVPEVQDDQMSAADVVKGESIRMSMDIWSAAEDIKIAKSHHEYVRDEYKKYITALYAQGYKITVHPKDGCKIRTVAQYQGRGLVPRDHVCEYGYYEGSRSRVNWKFTGNECIPDIHNTDNLFLVNRSDEEQKVEFAILEFPVEGKVNFDIIGVVEPAE